MTSAVLASPTRSCTTNLTRPLRAPWATQQHTAYHENTHSRRAGSGAGSQAARGSFFRNRRPGAVASSGPGFVLPGCVYQSQRIDRFVTDGTCRDGYRSEMPWWKLGATAGHGHRMVGMGCLPRACLVPEIRRVAQACYELWYGQAVCAAVERYGPVMCPCTPAS